MWTRYAANCLWLLVPMMLLNVVLWPRLPKPYQSDVFWKDIPAWIRAGENATRTVLFILPVLMPFRLGTPTERVGLVLYVVGGLVYFLSWMVQIRYPESSWSASAWGFMAPGYTPLIWLTGIGLIGDKLFLPVPYSPIMYIALTIAFLAFHNLHVLIVYRRNYSTDGRSADLLRGGVGR
jgi:hypothetical protein